MHLRLIAVGKIREAYIATACADFRRRLAPYYVYEEIEVKAGDGAPERTMRDEAARILKYVRAGDAVWLLERTGSELSSPALSTKLASLAAAGTARLDLIVAGTFGADATLRARADFCWSLSQLTLLHEWARMLVLEQLYRAAKIAKNEPYHH